MRHHADLLLMTVLCVSGSTALQPRDIACGDGYVEIVTSGAKACCPGIMKTGGGTTWCCIGGNNECPAGEITCFDDLSSCKSTVNIADSEYKAKIKAITGEAPPTPDDDGSGSGTSGDTTTATPSATSASSSNEPSGTSATGATSTSSSGSSQTSVPANAGARLVGSKTLALGLFALCGIHIM